MEKSPKDVEIAFVGDSSYFSELQFRGIELAVAQFNEEAGQPDHDLVNLMAFRLTDAGDPASAQAIAESLVARGVSAVIGHSTYLTLRLSAEIYNANNVLMICPNMMASSDLAAFGNVYSIAPDAAQLGPATAYHLYYDLGIRQVALVYTPEWYEELATNFVEHFIELGGDVFYQGRMSPLGENLGELFTHISEENVEAIAFAGHPAAAAKMLQMYTEFQNDIPPVLVGLDGLWNRMFVETAGELAEGAYSIVPGQSPYASPTSVRFIQGIAEKGEICESELAHPFLRFGYDAALVAIIAVLESLKAGHENVLESMKLFQDEETVYVGTTGDLRFDNSGIPVDSHFSIQQVQGGEWVDVMPRYSFQNLEDEYGGQWGPTLASLTGGLASPAYDYAKLTGGTATAPSFRILNENTWPKGGTYCYKSWFYRNHCHCQFYLELECKNEGNVEAYGCWSTWGPDKCKKDNTLAKNYTQYRVTRLMSACTAGCSGTWKSCSDDAFCQKEKSGWPCYDQATCFRYDKLPKSGTCRAVTYLTPPSANMGEAPDGVFGGAREK